MRSQDIEMKERRKLAGSTTSATTYRDLAEAGITLENQGRFGVRASVIGSARVPQYPAAAGPWNDPVQVPDEPPLGYAINDLEITGERHEVEQSLIAASSMGTGDDAVEVATEVDGHSASGAQAPSDRVLVSPQSDGAISLTRGRKL